MGIDACVYVKTKDGQPPGISVGFSEDYEPGWFDVGGEKLQRYYSETYPRGHWPTICAVLLDCLASPCVEVVKYCGDHVSIEDVEPITLDRVFELSRHWVSYRHG